MERRWHSRYDVFCDDIEIARVIVNYQYESLDMRRGLVSLQIDFNRFSELILGLEINFNGLTIMNAPFVTNNSVEEEKLVDEIIEQSINGIGGVEVQSRLRRSVIQIVNAERNVAFFLIDERFEQPFTKVGMFRQEDEWSQRTYRFDIDDDVIIEEISGLLGWSN